jgi:predicted nucleic acid-binding protein
MTQVVDASAVVSAWLDGGPAGRWCVERLGEDDLAAPALMPFEVANIVRRTEARAAIDASAAAQAIDDLRRMTLELVPFESLADRAWQLRANLTVYDATYVALAEALGAPLVTLDRKLASAPGVRCEVRVAPDAPGAD